MPIDTPLTRRSLMTAAAALGAGLAAPAFAQQAYPARPVQLIVTFPAGTASGRTTGPDGPPS